MDKIKSITFNKEAQNNLPKEVKDKMKKDRKQAEKEQLILHGVIASKPICKFCNGTKTDPMNEQNDFMCTNCV